MRYKAKAIGSGSEGAQQELEDSWNAVRLRSRDSIGTWPCEGKLIDIDNASPHRA